LRLLLDVEFRESDPCYLQYAEIEADVGSRVEGEIPPTSNILKVKPLLEVGV
jgi:hypothetical protein